MQFAQPAWIVTGLIVCTITALLIYRLEKQKRQKIEAFAGTHLGAKLTRNLSSSFRYLKVILLLLALLSLFTALARPQYGFRWIEVKRKGIDILFALDTSRSMLVNDLRPNRLERARLGILDFVSGLEGDRVGLMPFAGASFLMTPLTLDYTAFETSLASVDTSIIPVPGSNISGLIEEASTILNNDANHKILVLMTDGENLEGDAVEAARKAAEKGVTIHTVGIGTAKGELVPLPVTEGPGFMKDREGRYVTSRLDESTLHQISEATGGIYAPLGNNGEGLQRIYQEKLALIPKEELAERKQRIPIERFGYPLTAAFVLLILEWLLPESRKATPLSLKAITSKSRRIRKIFAITLGLATLLSGTAPLEASEAERAYEAEDYLRASELYSELLAKDTNNPKLHYNFGTTAYKNNMYDDAITSFSQALKGDDLDLQAKAYYNRGNAHYKKGEEAMQGDPQSTVEQWKEAISSYEGAIKLNGADQLARDNLEIVRKKLEELEKQMQDQQDQDNNQQNNQDSQDGKQDKQHQSPKSDGQPDNGDQSGQEQQQQDDGGKQGEDRGDRQQQQPAENKEGENGKDGPSEMKPGSDNETPEESAQAADSTGESAEEGDPQGIAASAEGDPEKMSEEEAANLLNLMKSSEGELNFVPRFNQPQTSGRDW